LTSIHRFAAQAEMEAFHKDPMSLPMIMYHKNWPKNIEAMGEYF
jgi:hypothetical protein